MKSIQIKKGEIHASNNDCQYGGDLMQINYIEPNSQKQSFFEDAARFGLHLSMWMMAALAMYWFMDTCIKVF